MVLCLYVNPTIDKTIYLNSFIYGGTNRPYKVVTDGAGKAINTAVVLKELDQKVCVKGLIYQSDGEIITGRLDSHQISYECCRLEGASRTNTKIFDAEKQTITEINESGEKVTPQILKEIADQLCDSAQKDDVVVLTGSLPPGCEPGYYADIIGALHKKGIRCVLDADGEVLKLGVRQKPFLIKPNTDELAVLTGKKATTVAEVKEACEKLLEQGIGIVAVSMGSEGAVICSKEAAYFAQPIKVKVLSTVGAGDSMVAGMVANLYSSPDKMLHAGVAAATASITREGTRLCTRELFEQFYKQVKIERL